MNISVAFLNSQTTEADKQQRVSKLPCDTLLSDIEAIPLALKDFLASKGILTRKQLKKIYNKRTTSEAQADRCMRKLTTGGFNPQRGSGNRFSNALLHLIDEFPDITERVNLDEYIGAGKKKRNAEKTSTRKSKTPSEIEPLRLICTGVDAPSDEDEENSNQRDYNAFINEVRSDSHLSKEERQALVKMVSAQISACREELFSALLALPYATALLRNHYEQSNMSDCANRFYITGHLRPLIMVPRSKNTEGKPGFMKADKRIVWAKILDIVDKLKAMEEYTRHGALTKGTHDPDFFSIENLAFSLGVDLRTVMVKAEKIDEIVSHTKKTYENHFRQLSRSKKLLTDKEQKKVDDLKTSVNRMHETHNKLKALYEKQIKLNLRLVLIFIPKKSALFHPNWRMDNIQAGLMGLEKAVHIHDESYGALSTVAFWWMRKMVTKRIINEKDMIRTSESLFKLSSKLLYLENDAKLRFDKTVSEKEACKALNISSEALKLVHLTQKLQNVGSLDATIQPGRKDSLYDTIEAPTPSPEAHYEQAQHNERIIDFVNRTIGHDTKMLRATLLVSQLGYKLDEAGAVMGLTGERIRQINKKGLRLLKDEMTRLRYTSPASFALG